MSFEVQNLKYVFDLQKLVLEYTRAEIYKPRVIMECVRYIIYIYFLYVLTFNFNMCETTSLYYTRLSIKKAKSCSQCNATDLTSKPKKVGNIEQIKSITPKAFNRNPWFLYMIPTNKKISNFLFQL